MEPGNEVAARFDDAKTLLSFGAACVWLTDLDLLSGFYERASSAQEVAAGNVTLGQSLTAAHWRDLVEAAISFKAACGPFDAEVLAAVRELVLSARPSSETDELVVEWAACPSCGERRMDELLFKEDESVVCATCGTRYQLPGKEDE